MPYLPKSLLNIVALSAVFGLKNAFLFRILLWLPLGFISASNTLLPADEGIILPFSTIEAILLEPEVADKMATTDSLGRKGYSSSPTAT